MPDPKGTCDVTCVGVSSQFVIYGTQRGSIVHYFLGGGDSASPDAVLQPKAYKRVRRREECGGGGD